MEEDKSKGKEKVQLDQQFEVIKKSLNSMKGSELDNITMTNMKYFLQRKKRFDSKGLKAGGILVESERLKAFQSEQKIRKMMNRIVFLGKLSDVDKKKVLYLFFKTENENAPYYFMFMTTIEFKNPETQAAAFVNTFKTISEKADEEQIKEIKKFAGVEDKLEVLGYTRADTLIQKVADSFMAPIEASFDFPANLPRGTSQKLRTALNMKLVSVTLKPNGEQSSYNFYYTDKYDNKERKLPDDATYRLINEEPFESTFNNETAYELFMVKHKDRIEAVQKDLREEKRNLEKQLKESNKVPLVDAQPKRAKSSNQGVKNAVARYMRENGYVFKSFSTMMTGDDLVISYIVGNESKTSMINLTKAKQWIADSYQTGEVSSKIGGLITPTIPKFDGKSVPRIKGKQVQSTEASNSTNNLAKPRNGRKEVKNSFKIDEKLIVEHKNMVEPYKSMFTNEFAMYPQIPSAMYKWGKEKGVTFTIVMRQGKPASYVYILAMHKHAGSSTWYFSFMIHEFRESMTYDQMLNSYYKNRLAPLEEKVKSVKTIAFLENEFDKFEKLALQNGNIGKTPPKFIRNPTPSKDRWVEYAKAMGL